MLVPIELHLLSQRHGHLSPELAIGWRIGSYLREIFQDLSQLRIVVDGWPDAHFALASMSGAGAIPGEVTASGGDPEWDLLAYDPRGGRLTRVVIQEDYRDLPPDAVLLERRLNQKSPFDIAAYHNRLSGLIKGILSAPIDDVFEVQTQRCQPLAKQTPDAQDGLCCDVCQGCADIQDLWVVDNRIRCTGCAGLEPGWGRWN